MSRFWTIAAVVTCTMWGAPQVWSADAEAAPATASATMPATLPTAAETLPLLRKVADWQLANLPAEDGKDKHPNVHWVRGALFTGIMALHESTGDPKYLDAMMKICQDNGWKPGERLRHADDHVVGQTYCEIYAIKKQPEMIQPLRDTFDKMMADPKPGRVDWWWCDALFMAPPALVRLSAATGERKYLDYMDKLWWDTTDFLFDKQEHLYARDATYKIDEAGKGKREKNGEKIFWSRGNGWVLAGTARVLQYMPADYPTRDRYVALFKEMSARLAKLQQPDGTWHASLLDPASYPNPETSGTGFFTYAMAWGINQGILERETYLPVVARGWKALTAAVHEDGKLGWVQPIGASPAAVTKDSTREYGVGAFLLAGTQIIKLTAPPATQKAAAPAPVLYAAAATPAVRLIVKNELDAARPAETVTVAWSALAAKLPDARPEQLEVRNAAGKVLACQAVDNDGDSKPDELVFQADFASTESQSFTVGSASAPGAAEPKVFGRFVPERYDDFAWENDRIAFRTYGPALEKVEPQTGSGLDVWCKRTRALVINKWYKADSYHKDTGEGRDCYKVGAARGCGGTAVWQNDKMIASRKFASWKVLANGPVRVMFELTYAPWNAAGTKVSEVKRITLDAGENLNRIQSTFTSEAPELTIAIGVSKHDLDGTVDVHKKEGWLSVWGAPEKNAGKLGTGLVIDPAVPADMLEAQQHGLAIVKVKPGTPVTYYAGAGWDKSGDFADAKAWNAYLEHFSRRLASPLKVTLENP